MSQSLSSVYAHLTFSTKNRVPFIDDEIKNELWSYLGGICRSLECPPVIVGGFTDHIHILCLLSRKITQAKLVETVKKQSSKWIKTIADKYRDFYWQDGYGIFSVNTTEREMVVKYIQNQVEHHRQQTFQDELRAFLQKYKIAFDELYIWT